jgi:hypothetical protein
MLESYRGASCAATARWMSAARGPRHFTHNGYQAFPVGMPSWPASGGAPWPWPLPGGPWQQWRVRRRGPLAAACQRAVAAHKRCPRGLPTQTAMPVAMHKEQPRNHK